MTKVGLTYKQAQKELSKNIVRMTDFHQRRYAFTLASKSANIREFLLQVPFILHFNPPGMRFYVPDAPHGVYNFIPLPQQLESFANYADVNYDQLTNPGTYTIEGVYVMGSASSVTFTADSDIDLWVVVSPELEAVKRQALHQKLEKMSQWLQAEHHVEASFYIVDCQHLLYNRHTNQTLADGGIREKIFLLDEFYRSATKLAGKWLLWYFLPEVKGYSYQEVKQAFIDFGLIHPCNWIDFGDMDLKLLSHQAFYANVLWLIYKGLQNPFKSFIKIGLLEAYFNEYPYTELVSVSMKRRILQQDEVTVTPPVARVPVTFASVTHKTSPTAATTAHIWKHGMFDATADSALSLQHAVNPHAQASIDTGGAAAWVKNRLAEKAHAHWQSQQQAQSASNSTSTTNATQATKPKAYKVSPLATTTAEIWTAGAINATIAKAAGLLVEDPSSTNKTPNVNDDYSFMHLYGTEQAASSTYFGIGFDAYEMVLDKVLAYLTSIGDTNRQYLAITSFLLKVNKLFQPSINRIMQRLKCHERKAIDYLLDNLSDFSDPYIKVPTDLRQMLIRLQQRYAINKIDLQIALRFKYWHIGELVKYTDDYKKALVRTYLSLYKFVLQIPSESKKAISFTDKQELQAIEQAVVSLFVHHRNQIMIYNRYPELDLSEPFLYFGWFDNQQDASNIVWYVVNVDKHNPLANAERKHLEINYDLISLVCWCYFNGLITAKTRIQLKQNPYFNQEMLVNLIKGLRNRGNLGSYFGRLSRAVSDYLFEDNQVYRDPVTGLMAQGKGHVSANSVNPTTISAINHIPAVNKIFREQTPAFLQPKSHKENTNLAPSLDTVVQDFVTSEELKEQMRNQGMLTWEEDKRDAHIAYSTLVDLSTPELPVNATQLVTSASSELVANANEALGLNEEASKEVTASNAGLSQSQFANAAVTITNSEQYELQETEEIVVSSYELSQEADKEQARVLSLAQEHKQETEQKSTAEETTSLHLVGVPVTPVQQPQVELEEQSKLTSLEEQDKITSLDLIATSDNASATIAAITDTVAPQLVMSLDNTSTQVKVEQVQVTSMVNLSRQDTYVSGSMKFPAGLALAVQEDVNLTDLMYLTKGKAVVSLHSSLANEDVCQMLVGAAVSLPVTDLSQTLTVDLYKAQLQARTELQTYPFMEVNTEHELQAVKPQGKLYAWKNAGPGQEIPIDTSYISDLKIESKFKGQGRVSFLVQDTHSKENSGFNAENSQQGLTLGGNASRATCLELAPKVDNSSVEKITCAATLAATKAWQAGGGLTAEPEQTTYTQDKAITTATFLATNLETITAQITLNSNQQGNKQAASHSNYLNNNLNPSLNNSNEQTTIALNPRSTNYAALLTQVIRESNQEQSEVISLTLPEITTEQVNSNEKVKPPKVLQIMQSISSFFYLFSVTSASNYWNNKPQAFVYHDLSKLAREYYASLALAPQGFMLKNYLPAVVSQGYTVKEIFLGITPAVQVTQAAAKAVAQLVKRTFTKEISYVSPTTDRSWYSYASLDQQAENAALPESGDLGYELAGRDIYAHAAALAAAQVMAQQVAQQLQAQVEQSKVASEQYYTSEVVNQEKKSALEIVTLLRNRAKCLDGRIFEYIKDKVTANSINNADEVNSNNSQTDFGKHEQGLATAEKAQLVNDSTLVSDEQAAVTDDVQTQVKHKQAANTEPTAVEHEQTEHAKAASTITALHARVTAPYSSTPYPRRIYTRMGINLNLAHHYLQGEAVQHTEETSTVANHDIEREQPISNELLHVEVVAAPRGEERENAARTLSARANPSFASVEQELANSDVVTSQVVSQEVNALENATANKKSSQLNLAQDDNSSKADPLQGIANALETLAQDNDLIRQQTKGYNTLFQQKVVNEKGESQTHSVSLQPLTTEVENAIATVFSEQATAAYVHTAVPETPGAHADGHVTYGQVHLRDLSPAADHMDLPNFHMQTAWQKLQTQAQAENINLGQQVYPLTQIAGTTDNWELLLSYAAAADSYNLWQVQAHEHAQASLAQRLANAGDQARDRALQAANLVAVATASSALTQGYTASPDQSHIANYITNAKLTDHEVNNQLAEHEQASEQQTPASINFRSWYELPSAKSPQSLTQLRSGLQQETKIVVPISAESEILAAQVLDELGIIGLNVPTTVDEQVYGDIASKDRNTVSVDEVVGRTNAVAETTNVEGAVSVSSSVGNNKYENLEGQQPTILQTGEVNPLATESTSNSQADNAALFVSTDVYLTANTEQEEGKGTATEVISDTTADATTESRIDAAVVETTAETPVVATTETTVDTTAQTTDQTTANSSHYESYSPLPSLYNRTVRNGYALDNLARVTSALAKTSADSPKEADLKVEASVVPAPKPLSAYLLPVKGALHWYNYDPQLMLIVLAHFRDYRALNYNYINYLGNLIYAKVKICVTGKEQIRVYHQNLRYLTEDNILLELGTPVDYTLSDKLEVDVLATNAMTNNEFAHLLPPFSGAGAGLSSVTVLLDKNAQINPNGKQSLDAIAAAAVIPPLAPSFSTLSTESISTDPLTTDTRLQKYLNMLGNKQHTLAKPLIVDDDYDFVQTAKFMLPGFADHPTPTVESLNQALRGEVTMQSLPLQSPVNVALSNGNESLKAVTSSDLYGSGTNNNSSRQDNLRVNEAASTSFASTTNPESAASAANPASTASTASTSLGNTEQASTLVNVSETQVELQGKGNTQSLATAKHSAIKVATSANNLDAQSASQTEVIPAQDLETQATHALGQARRRVHNLTSQDQLVETVDALASSNQATFLTPELTSELTQVLTPLNSSLAISTPLASYAQVWKYKRQELLVNHVLQTAHIAGAQAAAHAAAASLEQTAAISPWLNHPEQLGQVIEVYPFVHGQKLYGLMHKVRLDPGIQAANLVSVPTAIGSYLGENCDTLEAIVRYAQPGLNARTEFAQVLRQRRLAVVNDLLTYALDFKRAQAYKYTVEHTSQDLPLPFSRDWNLINLRHLYQPYTSPSVSLARHLESFNALYLPSSLAAQDTPLSEFKVNLTDKQQAIIAPSTLTLDASKLNASKPPKAAVTKTTAANIALADLSTPLPRQSNDYLSPADLLNLNQATSSYGLEANLNLGALATHGEVDTEPLVLDLAQLQYTTRGKVNIDMGVLAQFKAAQTTKQEKTEVNSLITSPLAAELTNEQNQQLLVSNDTQQPDNGDKSAPIQTTISHLANIFATNYLDEAEQIASAYVFVKYLPQLTTPEIGNLRASLDLMQYSFARISSRLIEYFSLVYITKVGTYRNVRFTGQQALPHLIRYMQEHLGSKHKLPNISVHKLNGPNVSYINQLVLQAITQTLQEKQEAVRSARLEQEVKQQTLQLEFMAVYHVPQCLSPDLALGKVNSLIQGLTAQQQRVLSAVQAQQRLGIMQLWVEITPLSEVDMQYDLYLSTPDNLFYAYWQVQGFLEALLQDALWSVYPAASAQVLNLQVSLVEQDEQQQCRFTLIPEWSQVLI
ncbi:class I adenylate cyclase [Psittacicella hinzii]|uniref:Adenylate cyclase class-I N-terminal domain-containing protein n=1 Tax=Psittacicella hinzii TaxID=2028575 RepID=A0A3A1YUA3_9GAMM|nr:class I adenylate cyclase [Psittacicella hinzii]RIY40014.1 hypothetical protein CKF58_01225 [Psittacicella hinzii]